MAKSIEELRKEFIVDVPEEPPLTPILVFEKFLAIVQKYRDELAIREEFGDVIAYKPIANQIEEEARVLARRVYCERGLRA
jgi:hypothetical protein